MTGVQTCALPICWFGEYISAPRYPEVDWAPETPMSHEELCARLATGEVLQRNPASRCSFVRQGEGVLLFVDGEGFECVGEVAAFAETLCGQDYIRIDMAAKDYASVLALSTRLVGQGSLSVEQI